MAIPIDSLPWAAQFIQAQDKPGFLSELSSQGFAQIDNKLLALEFGLAALVPIIQPDIQVVAPDYTNPRRDLPPATQPVKPVIFFASQTTVAPGDIIRIYGSFRTPITYARAWGLQRADFIQLSDAIVEVTIPQFAQSGIFTLHSQNKTSDSNLRLTITSAILPPGSQLPRPIISPITGIYTEPIMVMVQRPPLIPPNAVIRYTIDGSTPTANSSIFTEPFIAYQSTTILAITMAFNYTNSPVASGTYVINIPLPQLAVPTLSPPAGTFPGSVTVTITKPHAAAQVYYTTNGDVPSPVTTLYTIPIVLNSTTNLRCRAYETGYLPSNIVDVTYTVTVQNIQLPTPTFAPVPGTFTNAIMLSLARSGSIGVIRYTTDGSTPTGTSPLYSSSISIGATTTVKAITTAT